MTQNHSTHVLHTVTASITKVKRIRETAKAIINIQPASKITAYGGGSFARRCGNA